MFDVAYYSGVQIPNKETESCYLDMNASQKRKIKNYSHDLLILRNIKSYFLP